MPLILWGCTHTHNRGKFPPLVELCYNQGKRSWEIQAHGVPLKGLRSHSLGCSIGEGSAAVGLKCGAGTFGLLP